MNDYHPALQELASISSLPDFRRLMRAACLRLGQLLNQTELARDVGLPQPTVHRWINLLETSYLAVRLPAYAVKRTNRLIKSPKLYWGDTGVALHLACVEEPGGGYLENLALCDLLAWRDARLERTELGYWRTSIGEEVDFVIETGARPLPIEVKATARPRLADTAHLRTFRRAAQQPGDQRPRARLARAGRCIAGLDAFLAGSTRARISSSDTDLPAAISARARFMRRRNSGLVLRASDSRSTFESGTRAASGRRPRVTTTMSSSSSRAYLASEPEARASDTFLIA